MTAQPIATVVVVGHDITAWSAAAALKRRIPSLDVQLMMIPAEPGALADRIISTTPSIHGFHRDIGLGDEDTIAGAASGLRIGTLFEGWAERRSSYVHAYGPYGVPIGGVAFHQLWLREHRNGSLPPFDYFSAAAQLARSGGSPQASSGSIQFGLQLTLERYRTLMRDYAFHLGVRAREATIVDVTLRPADGFIDALICDNGEAVRADLFVDCSGPTSLVRGRLDSQFIEWGRWLLSDRVILTEAMADATVGTMDRVTALSCGWRWAASSPQSSSHGLVYSSAHADDREIEHQFGGAAQPIRLRQGRRPDFWVKNCVAIGDAAVSVEPLEWTNLHLAHSQIDRIIAMMPGRDCAPVELSEFNRQCAAEADRVRDFLCLHYLCSRRSESFWKDAAAIALPHSVAHSLALFEERGRLPYYEEETFSRDSWLAVLFGQGFEPRRVDPLADSVSHAQAARAFTAMRQSLDSFTLPGAAAAPNDLNPHGIR